MQLIRVSHIVRADVELSRSVYVDVELSRIVCVEVELSRMIIVSRSQQSSCEASVFNCGYDVEKVG